MKIVPEQVARFIPGRQFVPLGTDGMGRSDTREALRQHFEVDMPSAVIASLAALAKDGTIEPALVKDAMGRYGVDGDAADPYTL
jgi:pyruvate dehydrogenase E1 component